MNSLLVQGYTRPIQSRWSFQMHSKCVSALIKSKNVLGRQLFIRLLLLTKTCPPLISLLAEYSLPLLGLEAHFVN